MHHTGLSLHVASRTEAKEIEREHHIQTGLVIVIYTVVVGPQPMPQDTDEDEERKEESEEDLVDVADVVGEPIKASPSDEDEILVVDVEDEGVEDLAIDNAREELVGVVLDERAVEVLAVDVEDEKYNERVEDLVVAIMGKELTEVVLDEGEIGRVGTLPVEEEDEVIMGLVADTVREDVPGVIINAGREADRVVEPE